MGNITSSFGVEIECLIATQEGDRPLNKPRQFQTSKGGPVIVEKGASATTTVDDRVREVIEAALKGHEGDQVIKSDAELEDDENAWHLREYRQWDVKRDISVRAPDNFYNDDPNLRNFGWTDIEVTTPALLATEKSYAEVHRVITALNEAFWLIAPTTAALHIHYGRGKKYIPLNDLRRMAAFLFAADPILTQMHPDHLRNEESFYCPSNRLYSNIAHGAPGQAANDHFGPLAGERVPEEVPESADPPQEPESRPKLDRGRKFTSIFPRGSLPCYVIDQSEFDRSYPPWMQDREYLPTSEKGKPLAIVAAARELLATEDGPTVYILMSDSTPRRFAYNFRAYNIAEYRRRYRIGPGRINPASQPKRTLEFRQAAGTVNPEEIIAHAKIAVRLCEWASTTPMEELWKQILDLSVAEKHSDWYDVFDLLADLDLVEEAKVVQRQMANARKIVIADEEAGSVKPTPAVTNPPYVPPETALSRFLTWPRSRDPPCVRSEGSLSTISSILTWPGRSRRRGHGRGFRIESDEGVPDTDLDLIWLEGASDGLPPV
ncbi:hypothetical protein F4804DRAFT_353953 [Jackrogersella minutella]|nr:hypothetical protein F4804DRAFT_353953 [Jackrogersella minutella]